MLGIAVVLDVSALFALGLDVSAQVCLVYLFSIPLPSSLLFLKRIFLLQFVQ